ncbi:MULTISPECIES: anti-sigma factor [Niallia]|uniref:anti-sigma factor n=1 Tax=Niallia TaxID=2837506 RepID=UPI00201D3CEA|nr:anti-sigma factor [Niallia circulans]
MSEEYKKRLEAYKNGELSKEEAEEIERDLEKMEQYFQVFEEAEIGNPHQAAPLLIDSKKQRRIVRRGKWIARLQTALTALGLIILFTILSSIFTAVYYAWGTPDRTDVYRNIIDLTLTVTDPYGQYSGTSTATKPYFGLETTTDIEKRVGDEIYKTGEYKTNFFFSLMGVPEKKTQGVISQQQASFSFLPKESSPSEWKRLEKVKNGTVASVYLSFSELLSTNKVFDYLKDRNVEIIWFAVDTGVENRDEFGIDPIGFPNTPIWHDDDMITDSTEKEGNFWFSIESSSSSSPEYTEGDAEILHKQFLKTLTFLKPYEKKAENFYFGHLELNKRIAYMKKHGINHYGVVITGPTEEILKLKKENWIRAIHIDEIGFWNWDE